MSETLSLTTTLAPHGPAAAVILTDDQVLALGGGKKVFPVRVTIGGNSISARLARMGGENLIGFSKAARAELGVAMGESVDITIEFDDGPREVEIPPALADALAADTAAKSAFDALSFTRRKEHARSVADAKKDDTRDRRVAAVIADLTGQ